MVRKKALAWLLSFVLVAGLAPVGTLAYADEKTTDTETGANAAVASETQDATNATDASDERSENEMYDLANSWRYVNGERIYEEDESAQTADTAGTETDSADTAGTDTDTNSNSDSDISSLSTIMPLAAEPWSETGDGTYVSSDGSIIAGAIAKGADISEHNGRIDWQTVRDNSDIDFVILRCGYGMNYTSQDDDYWSYNVSECERLGIPYGVYLYSYATDTSRASSEADHALRLLSGHTPTYPVYYDLEETSLESTSNRSLLASMASTFCNKIQAAGYTPGVYANLNWWNNYLADSVFNSWDRWVAQYNKSCQYTGTYRIWQCTSEGSVNGMGSRVDLDFWMDFDGETSQSFVRIAGNDRYETMLSVATEAFPNGCSTAVLTTGENFADALSGAALAGVENAPVLLTQPSSLSSAAYEAIQRLGVRTVYIVGGSLSVSHNVEDAVMDLGCNVIRISGQTRVDTAYGVYRQGRGLWTDVAIVATANSFPDALASSSYSYAKSAPIFLVENSLTSEQAEALSHFSRVIVCGGTSSVSAQLGDDIKALGVSVKRVSGNDRYATAQAFAEFSINEGMSVANGGVACGTTYPDALVAASLLGKNNGVLVLASNLSYTNAKSVIARKDSSQRFYVFGGAKTLSRITVSLLKP